MSPAPDRPRSGTSRLARSPKIFNDGKDGKVCCLGDEVSFLVDTNKEMR